MAISMHKQGILEITGYNVLISTLIFVCECTCPCISVFVDLRYRPEMIMIRGKSVLETIRSLNKLN